MNYDLTTTYDDSNDIASNRFLIKGALAKWVEAHQPQWTFADGLVWNAGHRFVNVGMQIAFQQWKAKKPIGTITRDEKGKLPSLDDLNAAIPQSEWELGLDGKPKPPWSRQFCVYMLDPKSFQTYTYLNSTYGACLAHKSLKEKIDMCRMVRGQSVHPVVTLASAPMKTSFGMKQRADFRVVDWVVFGGNTALPAEAPKAIEDKTDLKTVEAPTTAELMRDEIPFNDSPIIER